MAITKEKKQEVVDLLATGLKDSETTYFTDFTGVDVNSYRGCQRPGYGR